MHFFSVGIIHLSILLLTTSALLGQDTNNKLIKGIVIDADSEEPLIGASILNQCEGSGTITDVFGYFDIEATQDSCQFEISYTGYQSRIVRFDSSDKIRKIKLSPGVVMDEVQISADYLDKKFAKDIGRTQISIDRLAKVPNVLGEADVIKALSYTPGVSSGFEGSTGLNVRGGSPDQNLILLDDAKIYNGSHLAGFLSSFNSDALSHVELYKGDMPAKYGGRLSSVIDIRMKNGNKKQKEFEMTFSPIVSKLLFETPLKTEKTSLMVSARTSLIDLFTLPLYIQFKNGNRTNYVGYTMYDINAKLHHNISESQQLSVSLFHSRDHLSLWDVSEISLEEDSRLGLKYGNQALNLKYVHFLNNNLRLNSSVVYSNYDSQLESFGFPEDAIFNNGRTKTDVKSLAWKNDLNWSGNTVDFSFGFDVESEWFEPTLIEFTTPQGDQIENVDLWNYGKIPLSISTYGQFSWTLSDHIQLDAGARAWHYTIEDYSKTFIEPRASLGIGLGDLGGAKLAYSRTNQTVHFLASNGVTLPTDYWIPSVAVLPASQTDQLSLGYRKNIGTSYLIKVDAYYKLSNDLIAQREGTDYYNKDLAIDDKIISKGRGKAYGLEFFLQKENGKLNWWLGYTLSRSLREFDEINNGAPFPYRYDRIHDFSFTGSYDLSNKWSLQSIVVYATGTAVTRPSSLYALTPALHISHFNERNNSRLGDYMRMDLSFTKQFKKSSLVFGVYNITGRRNPLFERIKTQGVAGGQDPLEPIGNIMTELISERTSLFPFLPSISYSIKFK